MKGYEVLNSKAEVFRIEVYNLWNYIYIITIIVFVSHIKIEVCLLRFFLSYTSPNVASCHRWRL